MSFRFAYSFPMVPYGHEHRDHAALTGINAAWPDWSMQRHGNGILAVWPASPSNVRLEEFQEPRDCGNGVMYYGSKVKPHIHDLIRPELVRGQGDWLNTTGKDSLFVPLGLATPRQVLIGKTGIRPGDYVTELGVMSHEVYLALKKGGDGIPMGDPREARLLVLMLQAGHTVTEEMIEDGLPCVLSTADTPQMFQMLFGLDPKAFAADIKPSPSVTAPTPTSP